MPKYIKPFGFIFLRVSGAVLFFWLLAFFFKQEKIEKKDFKRLFLCGLFGVSFNQLLFFGGLNLTDPINAALMMIMTPILVLIISAIFLGEKITPVKLVGILLGAAGFFIIITQSGGISFSNKTVMGDFMVLLNATSYAIYLVLVKPLMKKYGPITIIKWVFLFGYLLVIPAGFKQVTQIEFASFTTSIWLSVVFVVLFTTCFAYLFNILALRSVNPTVVGIYIYLQPIFATFVALLLGKDELSIKEIIGGLLIFVGIYFVSFLKLPASKTNTV